MLQDLLLKLKKRNVAISLDNNDLKVKFNGAKLPDELIKEIRENKGLILEYLGNQQDSQETVDILPADKRESYPLSSSQQMVWVLSQLEGGNNAYHLAGAYLFEGDLDRPAMEYAFNMLLERHEILRTVFREDNEGEVRQYIRSLKEMGFRINYKDFRVEAEEVKQLVEAGFGEPFDLTEGPLLRVNLYQLTDNKWVFAYVMHHIISDGLSMGIFIREVLLFYNAYAKRAQHLPTPLRIHYKDYAVWQQEQLKGGLLNRHKSYWLKQFEGELPVLELPGDRPRPVVKTYNGAVVHRNISPKLSKELKALHQEQGATLFMGLLAIVNILLYRYTGQHDIIIGSPIAGREHLDLEDQIGFYINTLALRTRFKGEDSYRALLSNIEQVTLGAFEHQVYPFDELVYELNLKRDLSRGTLFDVMVVLHNTRINAGMPQSSLGDLNVSWYGDSEKISSKFDLVFEFAESGEGIQVSVEYNSDIYERETIVRLADHLEQLAAAIVATPEIPIQQLDYIGEQEKKRLLVTFNDTFVDYPREKTLADLFREQVEKSPDGVALVTGDEAFTYRELNEQAEQLCGYLKKNYAITTGDTVGIKLDRGELMIVALLGVLKAGAVCVPIDVTCPQERLDYIVGDCGCKVLLDEGELDRFLSASREGLAPNDAARLGSSGPRDLAYIIYTSGSTGAPKGCMLENRGIINHLFSKINLLKLDSGTVICHNSALHFVGGIWQLWAPLIVGGKVILCDHEELKDIEKLLYRANVSGTHILEVIPSQLNEYLSYENEKKFEGIQTLILTGERLNPYFVNKCYSGNPDLEIINTYGQTEFSDVTTSYLIPKDRDLRKILIGSPIQNTQLYILSSALQLCPIGIVGEICTSGDGISRGYINQSKLTAERFVPNPLAPGAMLFKTGDLGRWLPDGTLEVIGRRDDQVKIRGYRIELREVEAGLLAHQDIEEAVVIFQDEADKEKSLVAYIVGKRSLNGTMIRADLERRLPAYMIPTHYVQLDKLLLLPNGKVDRNTLPSYTGAEIGSGVEYVMPKGDIEIKLASIWSEILHKEKIGIKDNFFDLGGHSLKATRLMSRIHKAFEVKVTLKDLFAAVVLEEQAQLIARAKKTSFIAITPVGIQPYYPLSSAQRRLWVLSQFEGGNIAYNIPGVYVLEGALDREALAYSFQRLIERHEILRTVFKADEQGTIRQFVRSPEDAGFRIVYRDLRHEADKKDLVRRLVQEEVYRPFSLSEGPLLRSGLYQLSEDKWILTYVMHHIISDDWSMRILIRELLLFYNRHIGGDESPLSPLPIQYKDYASAQQGQLNGVTLQTDKAYWLRQLEGTLPVLELPIARSRPAVKTYNGDVVHRGLDPELSNGLKAIGQEQGATLFMGLLAAVTTLLYRYTGQQDIILGIPIAGRDHADLEDQIGFYVNALALRARFKGEDSYTGLIKHIKEKTLEAYEHQAYPFDELLRDLQLERDMSRSPLFDVLVDFHDIRIDPSMEDMRLGDLDVSLFEPGEHVVSKFDLTFMFTESEAELNLSIEFNSDLFRKESIDRLFLHFEGLLKAIVASPALPIQRLDYLEKDERSQLLELFNDTVDNYPGYRSVIGLFEEQVRTAPNNVAVQFGDINLTYKELDERSNRLGNYLQERYLIKADDLVGIMLDRSEKMIIAILGILKAGGAYVPIDPAYPAARKEYITKNSGIKILITQTDYIFDLDYYTGHVFAIDLELDGIEASGGSPAIIGNGEDLAYVIYTSGSTGLPKGCAVTQKNLGNYVQWSNNHYFGSNPEGRGPRGAGSARLDSGRPVFGLYTSLSFDLTVTSIFCSLTKGGRLVVYGQQEELAAILKHNFSLESGIDSIKLTPSHIRMLQHLDIGPSAMLRAIVGGEQVTTGQVAILKSINPAIEIYNEYGPTEATVGCIVKKLEKDAPILIGKPIARTSIYILDEGNALCPIGVTGEICIGGEGLTRGYLHNTSLTLEKFIANPFQEGERIYKTGDLGRWLADGDIEYIGRRDEQVKIKGYRIELGEIENVLQGYAEIDSATVVDRSNKEGDKELVAYLVSKAPLHTPDIRSYLSQLLPAYMLPSHFVQLETLPLTPNGKIDRKRLPDPEGAGMGTGVDYVAPRNEMEERFVSIWQSILEKEKIGVKDSFFDLGGDSIKILRMAAELRKELNLDIPIALIYKHNTIEAILADISQHTTELAEKTKVLMEREAIVRAEMDALAKRILATGTISDPENVADIYPMSAIEKGMLFGSQLNEDQSIYHDQFIFQQQFFDFKIERFRLALQLMAGKHSILRTCFNLTDHETEVQIVYKKIDAAVDYKDLSTIDPVAQEREIWGFMRSELSHPFDITVAPLWRMNVFNVGGDKYWFLWQFHHAILDGWSTASFTTELNNLYLKLGEDPLFKPVQLRSDYKDFVVWHEMDQKDDQAIQFWRRELANCTRLDLFTGENELRTYSSALGSPQLKKIEQIALGLNTTVKAISLSAYLYMLKILNYGNDIVAGLVTNNRPNLDDSDKVLGCFLNTIPLRVGIDGNERGADLVSRISNKLIELKDYERLSLSEISRINNEQQEMGNPFFDVLFNYVDFHVYRSVENDLSATVPEHSGASADLLDLREQTNTYFDFSVSVTSGSYTISLNTSKKFKPAFTVEQIAELYFRILTYIIDFPDHALKGLEILRAEERQKLLTVFDDTAVNYPRDKTIVSLFDAQVNETPDNVAVVFEDIEITYRDLNERANRLAAYLREKHKIAADDLVGVQLERSEWMVVVLIGVLKSGGAYVPIDPAYPQERIDYIISDSQCKVVIDEKELERFRVEEDRYGKQNPDAINKPADLAYVIYTSGTTGNPKGALIEHRNVVRLFKTDKDLFAFDASDVWTMFHSYCFDFSVWEMYGALLYGGKLIVIPQRTTKDPAAYLAILKGYGVTVLNQTPSAFYNLIKQELEMKDVSLHLRYVIFGGEALSPGRLAGWHARYPATRLINMYGITETTVHVTYKEITETEIVTNKSNIGRPIPTMGCYVLDQDQNLTPAGVPGELYVGGEGVSRGYLNREELTRARFVESPFRRGERLYRSGDKVKILENGEMEYMGRLDDQVKIRGYRIELSEVESALQALEEVTDVAVVARKDKDGENSLTAYVVSKEVLTTSMLSSFLTDRLPGYMVPAHYVQLDELPITANGKLDKKALPDPEGAGMSTGVEYVAPRNAMEEKLVRIWEALLGKDNLGIRDDFFELGGSSLKAVRVIKRMMDEIGLEIPIKLLFTGRNIENIAQYLVNADSEDGGGPDKVVLGERATTGDETAEDEAAGGEPSGKGQEGVALLSEASYNQLVYFSEWKSAETIVVSHYEFDDIDLGALRSALNQLIRRHEILRTVFVRVNGRIMQKILPVEGLSYTIADPTVISSRKELDEIMAKEHSRTIDLGTFPLFFVKVYKERNGRSYIQLTNHHIISDGYSVEIMGNDLTSLYVWALQRISADLAPMLFQYRDFANWQRLFVDSPEGRRHKEYWLKRLKGATYVSKLPLSGAISGPVSESAIGITRIIDRKLYKRLDRFAKNNGLTRPVVIMGTLTLLLGRLTRQDDVTIFGTVSGRASRYYGQLDVSGLIGFFVNSLLMRNVIDADTSILSYLHAVQDHFLEDLNYDIYPFEKLIQELPDMDVPGFFGSCAFYNYRDFSFLKDAKYKINELGYQTDEEEKEGRPEVVHPIQCAMGLSVEEYANCLKVDILFKRSLFRDADAIKINDLYFSILDQVLDRPQSLVKQLKS